MILLLDTHTLVWWLGDDPGVSPVARGAIADAGNDVVVSAATVWELTIKRAVGKIQLVENLAAAVEAAGFSGLPVTMDDAEAAAGLPPLHRDPFDRILVAHALRLDATIVSRDRLLEPYGAPILPA
ncbi:MAG: type II toxin-antitoxin system VapC family toxin [Chloroflexota bacterium]